MCNIDEVAAQGYQFAENGCKGVPVIDYHDDMELVAFNAGICNYNARNGTHFPKYKPVSATLSRSQLDKNPYPADHMSVQQASI